MINLTKQEARHIILMLSDYMSQNKDTYIEENINVSDGIVTRTNEIIAKLVKYGTEPDEQSRQE